MSESESVQGLGTTTQEVSQGAGGIAANHDAGFVDRPPPSRKVIRGGKGVGPCPDRESHYASWNSEDRSLPADVLPLLFEQAEHFPLEGRGLHCLGTELLVDLGDFLFGSLQDVRLLNSDSDSKGRAIFRSWDPALVALLHLPEHLSALDQSTRLPRPPLLPLFGIPQSLPRVLVCHQVGADVGANFSVVVVIVVIEVIVVIVLVL